jgi:hypothetical protein
MAVDGVLRRIAAGLRRLFVRRTEQRIELVAWRPLHAGGMLYVADFDRRRHAFVVAPNAACLLASYAIEDAREMHPCEVDDGGEAGDGAVAACSQTTGVEQGSV